LREIPGQNPKNGFDREYFLSRRFGAFFRLAHMINCIREYEKGKKMNHFSMNETPEIMPSAPSLAMAYVPWQQFTSTYEPQKALMVGTIFPELDKPFTGKSGGMGR
jgi:hypothetical protein